MEKKNLKLKHILLFEDKVFLSTRDFDQIYNFMVNFFLDKRESYHLDMIENYPK